VTRLIDRLIRRDDGYWEGLASGGAVLTTTYGAPDKEAILPQFASATREAYATNSVVFAAILARICLFSEATFKFRRASDKNLFSDARLGKLQQPWPDATEGELLARAEQDVSLAGNFFLWDAGDQLVRWRPDWVTIISAVTGAPGGGWYRRVVGYHFEPPREAQAAFGEPWTAPASDVVHWAPIPDPLASFRGMSWLAPAVREAQADTGMTAYKQKYLSHAATPNLLIKYAQKLQPATIDSLRERLAARYGGVGNAFGTLVLDQGADATIVGANLAQMDFSGVQQAGADRILADGNVPGVIVGLEPLRGAGRGYQESMRKFADLFGRPQWRSFCGALQKLTPGNDVDAGAVRLWYDTTDIAALQEGEQEKAQMSLIHAQAVLTYRNAGYTRESAVKAVLANDVSQLEVDPAAAAPQQQTSQHLVPQPPGSGPGVPPLPEGSQLRLPVGTVSPGDGGNATRPGQRPASVRRDLNGHGLNGAGHA
jgi:phage portal protein BeeE